MIDAAAGPTDPAFFNLMSTGLASLESVPQPAESLEVFTQAAADAGLPACEQRGRKPGCVAAGRVDGTLCCRLSAGCQQTMGASLVCSLADTLQPSAAHPPTTGC